MTLFLCGDVMTGRGVDQILRSPSRPGLRESYVRDARMYVALAEAANGPISWPVHAAYIWGDALGELERRAPHARVANLETSITESDNYWPGKGIHYRMHPENVSCLREARLDVCVLANNHVLDFGHAGLIETLEALKNAGLQTAGAGRDIEEARQPARVELPGSGNLFVFALGSESSGIPPSWAATQERPGVHFLSELSEASVEDIKHRIERLKRPGDVVVVSVHWGSNWGYEVPPEHVWFAHRLVTAGVDIVHGHSSHHPQPIEVYQRKLILYGCGDFINDYEGIEGHEEFRGDLSLMYFATLDPSDGALLELRMLPMQIRKMRLQRASETDARWLAERLSWFSTDFGSQIEVADGDLDLLLRFE
jgi:poly-gamma-glutamate capsule biosynthesis protein CapA/YwtB (metallophosphatase superfamily)